MRWSITYLVNNYVHGGYMYITVAFPIRVTCTHSEWWFNELKRVTRLLWCAQFGTLSCDSMSQSRNYLWNIIISLIFWVVTVQVKPQFMTFAVCCSCYSSQHQGPVFILSCVLYQKHNTNPMMSVWDLGGIIVWVTNLAWLCCSVYWYKRSTQPVIVWFIFDIGSVYVVQ